ncbi:hypothetical protein ACFLUJ_07730 [Chloroflexota bacterium]
MSGKSRRSKGNYSFQGRKKKDRLKHLATPTQQPVVTQSREPVSSPQVSVPSVSPSTTMVKPVAVRYPYIATELRTIGILAGIMLAGLVVLTLVLT